MKKIKKIALTTLYVLIGFIGVALVISLVFVVPFVGVTLAAVGVVLWFWRWSKLHKSEEHHVSINPSPPVSSESPRDEPSCSSPLALTVNRKIEIMNDCVSHINTSENLQTVLSRYGLLLKTLQELSEYEKNPAVSFPHELPSATLRRIESEKAQIMNRAIQRAYDGMLRKCAALKTENGRKNRQMKFFDELNALMPDFPEETRDFAVDFINRHINESLDGAGVQ